MRVAQSALERPGLTHQRARPAMVLGAMKMSDAVTLWPTRSSQELRADPPIQRCSAISRPRLPEQPISPIRARSEDVMRRQPRSRATVATVPCQLLASRGYVAAIVE